MTNRTPSWVWTSPTGDLPPPPVETRLQTLPLSALDWKDFQRLCVRLAALRGDVEHVQEYGDPGQKQHGIDIYLRLATGEYETWECKKYDALPPAQVTASVTRFLKGSWASRSKTFSIYTTSAIENTRLADRIEKEAARLEKSSVAFATKGRDQISLLLKEHPDLVDDFFGRPHVAAFCGDDAIAAISRRTLTPEDLRRLRDLLRDHYTHHFNVMDPGLPLAGASLSSSPLSLSLRDRYVLPDVMPSDSAPAPPDATSDEPVPSPPMTDGEWDDHDYTDRFLPDSAHRQQPEERTQVLSWLATSENNVLLGSPGIGKSTLLRFVALDLLADEPVSSEASRAWGEKVPVWIPFAMWVRMVIDDETRCSLTDVVTSWLHKLGARDELGALVGKAISEDRVLLLVDGIDEGSDAAAATTALGLLETHVSTRGVPVIATSRPAGFRSIGGVGAGWQVGTLADLDGDQQLALVARWLEHQERLAPDAPADDLEIQRRTAQRASDLMRDIRRDGALSSLAATPLLLCGIVALATVNVQLPRNRFRAYEELTALLLHTHQQRRRKAAMVREDNAQLSESSRERALCYLAYEMQRSEDRTMIRRVEAQELIARFLQDSLAVPPANAMPMATEALQTGTEAIGVLVERSVDDIGFLHLAFQEYLAASHLSRQPVEAQRALAGDVCGDPTWSEVLLSCCYLSRREDETDALIQSIETSPQGHSGQALQLVAQIAFSGLNCSAREAKRIAATVFETIEDAGPLPRRRALLAIALDGLDADAIRTDTRERLSAWGPARTASLWALYQQLAEWPASPQTTRALVLGLQDTWELNARTAGESLGRVAAQDSSALDELKTALRAPHDTTHAAAALLGLSLHPTSLESELETWTAASGSQESKIALVGMNALVRRGGRDTRHRERLLDFARDDERNLYGWSDLVSEALAAGWPDDAELKRECLMAAGEGYGPRPLDQNIAISYLVKCYPQDDEFAEVLAQHFRNSRYPSRMLGGGPRSVEFLATHFAGHPILVPALEEWMANSDNRHSPIEYSVAGLTARSDTAKHHLLKWVMSDDSFAFWGVDALMQGWGADDADIGSAFRERARTASSIAYLALAIPDVIPDRSEARSLLLAAVKEHGFRSDYAIRGLSALGCDETDEEVFDHVRKLLEGRLDEDYAGRDGTIGAIFEGFSGAEIVRAFAERELVRPDGAVSTVARHFGKDAEMRRAILAAAAPLHHVLRGDVVYRLAGRAAVDSDIRNHLQDYTRDSNRSVASLATVAHAEAVQFSGEPEGELLTCLEREINAIGPSYEARRQAALAGLLALGRFDIVEAHRLDDVTKAPRSFGFSIRRNLPVLRQVLRHWEATRDALGDGAWGMVLDEQCEVLERAYTDLRSDVPNGFHEQVEAHKPDVWEKAPLAVLTSIFGDRARVRETCRRLLRGRSERTTWRHARDIVLAGELLGATAEPDEELLQLLEDAVLAESDAAVIAMSTLSPDSAALHEISGRADLSLLTPATIAVACAVSSTDRLAAALSDWLRRGQFSIWDFPHSVWRSLSARADRDESTRDALTAILERDPAPAERASYPGLIRGGARLEEWLNTELERLTTKTLPDFGYELRSGQVRPLVHCIAEALRLD